MKKVFLRGALLLLFAFSTTSAWAQDGDFPSGIFGVRLMPTITSLDYTETQGAVETSFVLGYGVGVLLGTNFNEHVGLQGEIIYSRLAQKYKVSTNVEQKVTLDFVSVPLLLSLNTGINNPVNFNFVIGPQLGLNVGSDVEVSDGAETDTIHAVLGVKRGDIGFAYGAGVDFGSDIKFSIGFRGVYGLLDVSDQSQTITTNEYYVLDRSHIRTYSGYIGVSFLF